MTVVCYSTIIVCYLGNDLRLQYKNILMYSIVLYKSVLFYSAAGSSAVFYPSVPAAPGSPSLVDPAPLSSSLIYYYVDPLTGAVYSASSSSSLPGLPGYDVTSNSAYPVSYTHLTLPTKRIV